MRPFSPRMFPHRVTLKPLAETTDSSAGVVESFAASSLTPLPCRVRFSGNLPSFAADAETSVTTGHLAFPADPGVSKGDEIQFGSRSLRVIGPAQTRDADAVLFVVAFESID